MKSQDQYEVRVPCIPLLVGNRASAFGIARALRRPAAA